MVLLLVVGRASALESHIGVEQGIVLVDVEEDIGLGEGLEEDSIARRAHRSLVDVVEGHRKGSVGEEERNSWVGEDIAVGRLEGRSLAEEDIGLAVDHIELAGLVEGGIVAVHHRRNSRDLPSCWNVESCRYQRSVFEMMEGGCLRDITQRKEKEKLKELV